MRVKVKTVTAEMTMAKMMMLKMTWMEMKMVKVSVLLKTATVIKTNMKKMVNRKTEVASNCKTMRRAPVVVAMMTNCQVTASRKKSCRVSRKSLTHRLRMLH